ncbi:unnamed protein product [Meloidogyne enterolobii]|uniref:Uncharacterized protein n=1 Tax=Meloidogyne enterolobii TaxID=390850 RepID=A0ACB0XML2_MELEN
MLMIPSFLHQHNQHFLNYSLRRNAKKQQMNDAFYLNYFHYSGA